MKVHTTPRPYGLMFSATGTRYPLTQEDAERLLAEYPVKSATRNQITLRADDGHRVFIYPATLGGGDAFIIER